MTVWLVAPLCIPRGASPLFLMCYFVIFRQESRKAMAWWEHWIPGGGYSQTLPIRVCAAQRGRDFEASGLERGIHFRRGF